MTKKAPKKGRRAPKRAIEPQKRVPETRLSVAQMRLIDKIAWDAANVEHVQKHGVRLAMIEAALLDPQSLIFDLGMEKSGEQRFAFFARVGSHLLRVIVTPRRGMMRPISATPMSEREVKDFKAWESRTKKK
jgi:uncharacterized protein